MLHNADVQFTHSNSSTNHSPEIFTFPPIKINPAYAKRTISDPYKITFVTICCFIAILSVIGNITLSAVILRTRKLRTATNILLLSLVAADLLTAVLLIPVYLERFLHQTANDSDRNLCLLRKYLYVTTSSGSLISLAVVSFDRMFAISNGFLYERWMTKKVAYITITVIWVWTITFNSLTFLSVFDWQRILSICIGGIPQTLFFIVTPTGFYLPGIVIIGAYIKIYFKARKVNKKVQHDTKLSIASFNQFQLAELRAQHDAQQFHSSNSQQEWTRRRSSLPDLNPSKTVSSSSDNVRRPRSTTTLSVRNSPILKSRSATITTTLSIQYSPVLKSRSSTIISQTIHEGKEKIRKVRKSISRDMRTVKTIALLVGLFLLCWSPTAGFHIYVHTIKTDSFENQDLLLMSEIFTVLSFVNCALDPYLYTIRNVELREATSKTFSKLYKRMRGIY
jgi:7 transmembrane receptor (rhodopsin family).